MASQKLSQYNFPVKLMQLKTDTGLKTTSFGVVRTDTKKVIGVVGSNYRYIPHKKVIDKIENSLPISVASKKIEIAKGGAVMIARYDTLKIEPAVIRKNDVINFRVEIVNSYDGTYPVLMRLAAMRVVCENGMIIPKSLVSLSFKHTSGADILNARKLFNEKLVLFTKAQDIWKKWSETVAKKAKIDEFFKRNLSYKAEDQIMSKFVADKDDSVWGLYNALTYYITHKLDSRIKSDLPVKRFRMRHYEEEAFYRFNWN